MSNVIGQLFIALAFTFLFITNLVAVCFIATDPLMQNLGNSQSIETSYVGVSSTVIISGIGLIVYWILFSRNFTKPAKIVQSFGKRKY